jgi:dienelactone hydrolase
MHGEQIEYRADNTLLKGYIAYDATREGRRPGILVIPEWWGLNEYARRRTRMLAELGYTALAVDMYGEGRQASRPEEAQNLASAIRQNLPLAEKRFKAALQVLTTHPTVDQARIAAIGYCFGGGIALAMARAGVDLDGVVSFHGTLPTAPPVRAGSIKTKMLVLTGGADPLVTEGQIAEFKREMEAASAGCQIITYPGAKHAFTNPQADILGREYNMPIAYDPVADRQSWHAMQKFFNEIFKEKAE